MCTGVRSKYISRKLPVTCGRLWHNNNYWMMIFKLGKLLIFYMWKKYTGITNQLRFLNSKYMYKQLGNNLMNFMKVSSSLQTKVKPHMELYFYLDIVFFYFLTRLIQTVHEILRHWEIKAINNHITKWIALIIQKFN